MNIELIPVTAFQQNCSLIWDEQRNAAIIDPGGDAEKLIKRIEELDLNLQAILLTHGHLDHVGAAPKLKAHFKVEIIGPNSQDEYWFNALPAQSQKFGLFEIPAFMPDRWLNNEGEIIQVGDMQFEVLHLPGHTPGHIGFIEHEKRIAFTGDVLFKQSIGRTDFQGGDHATLLSVIKEKLYPLGDDMIIVTGHGPYTTIGQEKQHNPFVR
ncbi:MBL fold metallo-hydrolase [Pasteurella multocida]|uniref:MBL fold metallo-hydrolase n=1 Tax=Pasteurella multocida TaxID=747 RepID=UPI000BBD0DDC|nr:MBL fold metallo-hydrolase [Pasteurella multocida]ATF74265.1 MBL fold metallo-hydrolase [Pasteurella multocida]ATN16666.1 MBL fold metallo-hydrolase [Pasteurella multocida]HDR1029668.1 MBL fold metallo-hydrolase [Pasteurella multocida]HDR1207912.1 MBL fold metallo-hydrolase [Pasteurella multocida]HDR1384511.1 MBL fold metallo-hydrolase [Pasteurella multocida]